MTDAMLAINSPTWGAPDHGAADRLQSALGEGAIWRRVEHRGELTLDVPVDRWVESHTEEVLMVLAGEFGCHATEVRRVFPRWQ